MVKAAYTSLFDYKEETMSTKDAFQKGLLSLFVAIALSSLSIGLATADQTNKLQENCVFSFMEDPCRHVGQADVTGPRKVGDLRSQGAQTSKELAEDCVFSFMEDPCRHVGEIYVNGPIEMKAGRVHLQVDRIANEFSNDCIFSAIDPCRHVRSVQMVRPRF